jgi:hypothetical protein
VLIFVLLSTAKTGKARGGTWFFSYDPTVRQVETAMFNGLGADSVHQGEVRSKLKMTMARGLESLSTELFDQILSHVTTYDERRSLSSVSRHLNKKMIPHLYNSWCFDGNKHTFRSLHYFLRSILLNPEIASHVRKLDIRKWGIDEPEDYPMSDGSDGGTYDDYAREEGDDETDRPANEQPAENSEDENSAAALPDEGYEGDIPLFRNAINNYGFDEATIEWFIEWIQKQDPDILLAILLIKLPNLTKLNMAIPESQSAIPQLVEMLLGQETPLFLRNLETINLCSSLHMGVSKPYPTHSQSQ